MEHRWGERFVVDIAVRVSARRYAMRTGRLVDLSVSGGHINVQGDLRLLSRVQIAITCPQRTQAATPVISAYVTRKHGDGVGVEWCDFAPQPVIELLRSVAQRRPDRRRGMRPTQYPSAGDESPTAIPSAPLPESSRRHGT